MFNLQRAARALLLSALGVLTILPSITLAQSFPTKPVHLILPFAVGGTSDLLARSFSDKLSELWKQPVVIEAKPGANGNIAADFIAKSQPDGHTIMLADIGNLAIAANAVKKPPFDPLDDLVPL